MNLKAKLELLVLFSAVALIAMMAISYANSVGITATYVKTTTTTSSTTTSSSTSTSTSTTTIPVCSGTPIISLNSNPTDINQNVNIVVSGLTGCSGVTIDIDSYEGCTPGDILTSFVSGPTGGNVIITGQAFSGGYGQKPNGGTYGYWACVGNKASQASEAQLVVLKPPKSTTYPTTTIKPTTTIPVCSGTPIISLNPNPATISQNVNIVVSGLSNCNGVTIDIDSYKGCTQSDILTSFVSGPTGGNVIITGQPFSGGYGQKPSGIYGYWACAGNKPSQASEAMLMVLPYATTTYSSTSATTSTTKPTTSATTTIKKYH